MSDQVERFNFHVGTVGQGAFVKSDDGHWVRYSDYEEEYELRLDGDETLRTCRDALLEAQAERDQEVKDHETALEVRDGIADQAVKQALLEVAEWCKEKIRAEVGPGERPFVVSTLEWVVSYCQRASREALPGVDRG